jgi:site-specific recombinase XerD
MAELIYGSGLRKSELVGVDIEDIDFTEEVVQVTGKGNKVRNVPLTEKCLSLIREYLSERQAYRRLLFKSQHNRRISKQTVYEVLKLRACMRPHQLRHACATHMLTNGCPTRVLQELLGHKDLRSTQVYTHLDKEQLREVINKNHPRKV